MKKFWMVIKESGKGSDNTFKRHESYKDAKEEAERLCRYGHTAFIILEAMEICNSEEIPVNWSYLKEE